MKHIVNWEADKHDNCHALILSELLTIPEHESDDGKNDHCDAPNGKETCDDILSHE